MGTYEDCVYTMMRYTPQEKTLVNLVGLKTVLLSLAKESSCSCVQTESDVVRKLVYKMAGPFRGQKHFQWLQRVNRYLKFLESYEGFARRPSDLIILESDGSGRCFSGERWWTDVVSVGKKWLHYASLVVKSAVECFKLTFQQLDMELFVTNNLLVVGVMSRLAVRMSQRLQAVVDQMNSLIAGWHGKLKFVDLKHQTDVPSFTDVVSLFGSTYSTVQISLDLATALRTDDRDQAVMAGHLQILRSLLNCSDRQLPMDYRSAATSVTPRPSLFNWSTSLADDTGEKIVRPVEKMTSERSSKVEKAKKISTGKLESSSLTQLLNTTKSAKGLKQLKKKLSDTVNTTKLTKVKKKKLNALVEAVDTLLRQKKSLTKPQLKREFRVLKEQLTSAIAKIF